MGQTNKFLERYSSKIAPLYIPLADFDFFHSASSEEEVDKKFIGRKAIGKKLSAWLNTDNRTGVYLVTGFRGMGKSSFVGKVLNEISGKPDIRKKKRDDQISLVILMVFVFCVSLIIYPLYTFNKNSSDPTNILVTIWWILLGVVCLLFFLYIFHSWTWTLLLKKMIGPKSEDKQSLAKKNIIPIKLNLGHETLNERDILGLISNSIEHKYKEYYKNVNTQPLYYLLRTFFVSLVSAFFTYFSIQVIIEEVIPGNRWKNPKFLEVPNAILKNMHDASEKLFDLVMAACVFLILFFILYYVWKSIENILTRFLPHYYKSVEKRLMELNLRIASSTNEDISPSAGGFSVSSMLGVSFIQRKVRNYPLASVREIEQELSWILETIDQSSKKAPRFVIVFDEIDKIDPAVIGSVDNIPDILPEYENVGSGFAGGAISRRRKQNLMRLLANMKFFISTAKAKFIFIAGRELYDAFLADASDREFAVGSIFNNVIYVDSFLNSESSPKDITMKTEQYICRQIIPHNKDLNEDSSEFNDYYTFKKYTEKLRDEYSIKLANSLIAILDNSINIDSVDKELIMTLKKISEGKKSRIIELSLYIFTTLLEINLSEMPDMLYNEICNLYITGFKNKLIDDKRYGIWFRVWREIRSVNKKNILKKNVDLLDGNGLSILNQENNQNKLQRSEVKRELKDYITESNFQIEKTILMLKHFATYLAHVSIGAPKKISIHFEKYLKKKDEVEASENPSRIIIKYINCEPEYYLAFNYRAQQKIGFVHYMAFPLINAILDNASIYGDKLLISGCFLTNHIYKYHNNGFSWRNLENIPELLDINKSPELREFINVIVSYIQRSHLSSAINGIYHFKFPMKITEEISIMSKLSEEVSALFNFSLDDSLSVKRHYFRMLEYYSKKHFNKDVSSPTAEGDPHHIISAIHQILGDLHLLDEQYNEAIFEYQSAIDSLQKDDIDNNNSHYPAHMLSLVRVMLKLGLTYEKRKTYNTAYITYNQLISRLIEYRYVDESELGLEYVQEIRNDFTWKDKWNVLQKGSSFKMKNEQSYKSHIYTKIDGEEREFRFVGEELIPQFNNELTPKKNTLIVRLTMFEDVRLLYQALLARLFVLEKKGLGGITRENIEMLESDFTYLHRFVYFKEKYMIAADFFRKMADILYYKNGLVTIENAESFFMTFYFWDYNVESDFGNYFMSKQFKESTEKIKNEKLKDKSKQLKNYKDYIDKMMRIKAPVKCKIANRKSEIYNYLTDLTDLANEDDGFYDVFSDFFHSQYCKINRGLINISLRKGFTINCSEKNISKRIEELNKQINHTLYKVCKYVNDEKIGNKYVKKYSVRVVFTDKNNKSLQDAENDFTLFKIKMKPSYFLEIEDLDVKKTKKSILLSYSKVSECRVRRMKLLDGLTSSKSANVVKNKRTPCYACKYYNRTLKIIMKNMLGRDEIEHQKSKVLYFLEARYNRQFFYSLKESDLFVLASTLDGMGNVLFSCSCLDDNISDRFMEEFERLISVDLEKNKRDIFNNYAEHLSHLEKSLLYFWTATFYYRYSSNKKEAYLCLKKILHVFVSYLEVNKESPARIDTIKKSILHIKKHIFNRAMQNLYSHYENTSMVEIQKIKWVFSVEMYGSIPLNELSIYPDAEEIILLYYKIELLCNTFTTSNNMMCPDIFNLYKNLTLGRYRVENTITERIVGLRFKSDLNMYLLKQLLPYNPNTLFKPDFLTEFYSKYKDYILSGKTLKEDLGDNAGFLHDSHILCDRDQTELMLKMDLVEFLIIDSIFNLSKIVETLSPVNQTTLFSESYIAGVYDELFEFNQLYEFVYLMYRYLQKEDDMASITGRIEGFIRPRIYNNKIITENQDCEKKIDEYSKEAIELLKSILKEIPEEELKSEKLTMKDNNTRSHRFFYSLMNIIRKADVHMNMTNYHAEMALEKYKKATEMHREGKSYQEMISNMYLIEDDLNNNTCQFYFAIERYCNNCGTIDDRITKLKSICKVSSLLEIGYYTK